MLAITRRTISIAASSFISGDGEGDEQGARAPPCCLHSAEWNMVSAHTTDKRNDCAHWQEWRERCALGLCTTRTQHSLRDFAGIRFARYVNRYAHKTNAPDLCVSIRVPDAWHLFETYMMVKQHRSGKRYKEWLFSRPEFDSSTQVQMVEAGAALLMRDVVRDHLRREYSPEIMTSMNKPITGDVNGLTLEDLLPGDVSPADEAAAREFRALADEHARTFFAGMTERQKLILAAKSQGIALSDPGLEERAGCRKSVLTEAYRRLFTDMAEDLAGRYRDDDRAGVRTLVLWTFDHLTNLCSEELSLKRTPELAVAEAR